MKTKNTFSCFVIGNQSRLIKCSENILEKGHTILGIISSDISVKQWAEEKCLKTISIDDDIHVILKNQSYDYLFSIDNFLLLPGDIINTPKKFAINFHDGPLPKYAGSNVTSWAILNEEHRHGITWHVMSRGADKGDILKQDIFPIEKDETSFSLNMKCLKKSIKLFSDLLDELDNNRLKRIPQDLSKRSFFPLWKRPRAACVIDFKKTADSIFALCNALEYGTHSNPLGVPKIYFGDEVIIPKKIQVLSLTERVKPGILCQIEENSLIVSTASNNLRFCNFQTIEGKKIIISDFLSRHGLRIGEKLPELGDKYAETISRINTNICKHEAFWTERLLRLKDIDIPYFKHITLKGDEIEYQKVQVPIPFEFIRGFQSQVKSEDLIFSIWVLYLYRISGSDEFDIYFSDTFLRNFLSDSNVFFVQYVPFHVSIHGWYRIEDLICAIKEEKNKTRLHKSYARDIVLRNPKLRGMLSGEIDKKIPIAISIVNDLSNHQPRHGTELEIVIPKKGKECFWIFNKNILDTNIVEKMKNQFLFLLSDIAEKGNGPLNEYSIVTKAEKDKLLIEFNNTKINYTSNKCLHEIFEAQVQRTPEKVAVLSKNDEITYCEFNRRANKLAHHLQSLGVGPETLIGVYMEPSFEMLISLYGILKSGGAYVPLDPEYPAERISFMLEDTKVSIVLIQKHLEGNIPKNSSKLVCVDSDWDKINIEDDNNLKTEVNPDNLAYTIYTSGSTGKPKGVMNKHRGICNQLFWMQDEYKLNSDDRVLQKTLYSFDLSVWEFFWPLLFGATLVIAPPRTHKDANAIVNMIKANNITTINFVPSMMQIFLEERRVGECKSLKRVLCIGEALSYDLKNDFIEKITKSELHNLYGPTEASVAVTYWACHQEYNNKIVYIGKPVSNSTIYITDSYMQPVPVMVPGELHIGGVQLSRGYIFRPDLTAEKFIPNPFDSESGNRLYKTGDLGRYSEDGNITYMNRMDDQIKIRGFRIELGEIEVKLNEIEAIKEAVVISREDISGDKRLVVYFTLSEDSGELTIEDIRSYLSRYLPEYMVPLAYVKLKAIPLTPNGKTDRKALPTPEGDAYARGMYEAPVGAIEEQLSRIWSNVLNVERVSRNDNFIDLGGHSLLALTLIEHMRRKGLSIDVRDLFTCPTLKDLAAFVGLTRPIVEVPPNLIRADSDQITPDMLPLIKLNQEEINSIIALTPCGVSNIQDIYPLAPLQEGILFHHLMNEERDAYILSSLIAFDNRDLLDNFLNAFQKVIDRHDILRTAILWKGLSEPVQVVWRRAKIPVKEVAIDPSKGKIVDQMIERFTGGKFPIDIRRAPMIRAFIVRDDNADRWILAMLHHHLIMDRTTLDILHEEIRAYRSGTESKLHEALPFRNYIAQAKLGISSEEHETFFREMLLDVEEPTAPYGLLDVIGDGSDMEVAMHEIDISLSRRLRDCTRKLRVSAASIFHLAWARVICSLSNRDDVVFGTILFGRMKGGEGSERVMGMFINTLPIRIKVRNDGVEEAIKKTYHMLTDLLHHEHATLALAQRCSGVLSPMPLFSSLLNYRYIKPIPAEEENSISVSEIEELFSEERTNYPLMLSVNDLGEGYSITAQVRRPIDPNQVCRYMNTVLGHLADALDSEPLMVVGSIDVLSKSEMSQILYEWNDTSVKYKKDKSIQQLFEDQVEKTPDSVALEFEDNSLSYRQLNERTNQLAYLLRDMGAKPGSTVSIMLSRSQELVVGVLSVIKAGATCLPIDPEYPRIRIFSMLEESRTEILLIQKDIIDITFVPSQGRASKKLENSEMKILLIDNISDELSGKLSTNLSDITVPENVVYILYTSGSTGSPKGVEMPHSCLLNLIQWHIADKMLYVRAKSLQFASLSFDVSFQEIFTTLCSGGTLVLVTEEIRRDMNKLICLKRERCIERLFIPYVVLKQLGDAINASGDIPKCISQIITAGEQPQITSSIKELFKKLKDCTLYNHYGPTESHVVTSYSLFDDVKNWPLLPPIGKPIANTQIYILDSCFRPVPIGGVGEIYIGGMNLAYGYHAKPVLTTRFIPNPFSKNSGERIYKTGDLARYLEDGNIAYLGRIDNQVKIRGFRIELGEIEVKLSEFEGIKEVVVLSREDMFGEKRLVAYYTLTEDSGEVAIEDIRSHLSKHLPGYMMPSAYVVVQSIPLTPNGKTDRKALPIPEGKDYVRGVYETPVGALEELLSSIWSKVLNVEHVGRNDNFFDLGGHSLLAVQLISRLRNYLDIEVELGELFSNPHLKDFAFSIRNNRTSDLPDITKIDRGGDDLPLSFAQQRLWFIDQLEKKASQAYHIFEGFRITGALNRSALCAALDRIVERHEVLRTTFNFVDGIPVQKIASPQTGFALKRYDVSDISKIEINKLIEKEATHPFDLSTGPLIRGQLLRETEEEHIFLITMHHIVSDGWSIENLMNEMSSLYNAFSQGKPDPLPALHIQYADYTLWQRNWLKDDRLQDQINYWKTRLSGSPELLKLPIDKPRSVIQDYSGTSMSIFLDAEITSELKRFNRSHGVTMYMTLLAGWVVLLTRLSGQNDLVIGTPVASRTRMEIEPLIGFFVNTLVLRFDLSDEPTISELITKVRETTLSAQKYQDIPFEQLVEELQPERSLSYSPLFQVIFTWQNTPHGCIDMEGLTIENIEYLPATANFDLSLSLLETDDGIKGTLNYATGLFERNSIKRYIEYFKTLLKSMVSNEKQSIYQLNLFRSSELSQLLYEWNDTEEEYFKDKCIHELIEDQVEDTPDVIAAAFESEYISYREMNVRANQLSRYLVRIGIRIDNLVGIYIDQSLEMVIGLYGILKSGGAYVPLDPQYPEYRLRNILSNSKISVVLTKNNLENHFFKINSEVSSNNKPIVVCLDSCWDNIDKNGIGINPINVTTDNLAYVIYTSGSTGKPKGVMINHYGLVNYTTWARNAYDVSSGQGSPVHSSLNFDLTITSLYLPLLTGKSVVLVSENKSIEKLSDIMENSWGFSLVKLTPAHLEVLGQMITPEKACGRTQRFIIGGEALKTEIIKFWRRYAPETKLINEYGPTETVVGCCIYEIDADEPITGSVPIGRPIANIQLYLLDYQLNPVPIGVAGELYIGGAGVGRGYLNRPELTAEKYIPNLFGLRLGESIYRTGDLGKYLKDGNIEFLGRIDNQIKIRGYRIELGEIEEALCNFENIKEAVVLKREDTPGENRLAAYFTLMEVREKISIRSIKDHLSRHLPNYMIPSAYIKLEEIPLTINGKIDRRALPAPEGEVYARGVYEDPVGEVEEILSGIWSEVLNIEQVGRNDNFFDLGGHSLLAITLIERMRRAKISIDLRSLFTCETLADMAMIIKKNMYDSDIEAPINYLISPFETVSQPSDENMKEIEI